MGLDLRPFPVVDLVCDLDDGDGALDISCLFGYLGAGVSCLGCLGDSLEDLVVVKFLL